MRFLKYLFGVIFRSANDAADDAFTMTFDPLGHVAYIYNRGRKSEKGVVKKTIQAESCGDAEIYIDYDKDGKIFGIEILYMGQITLAQIVKILSEKR